MGARRGGGARRLPRAPPAGRGARRDARGLRHRRHRDLPHAARRAARGRGRLLHGHGRARARRAGVRGGRRRACVSKGDPSADLLKAVLLASRGRRYTSPGLRRPRPGPRLRGALAQAAQRAAAARAGPRAPADRRGDAHRRGDGQVRTSPRSAASSARARPRRPSRSASSTRCSSIPTKRERRRRRRPRRRRADRRPRVARTASPRPTSASTACGRPTRRSSATTASATPSRARGSPRRAGTRDEAAAFAAGALAQLAEEADGPAAPVSPGRRRRPRRARHARASCAGSPGRATRRGYDPVVEDFRSPATGEVRWSWALVERLRPSATVTGPQDDRIATSRRNAEPLLRELRAAGYDAFDLAEFARPQAARPARGGDPRRLARTASATRSRARSSPSR